MIRIKVVCLYVDFSLNLERMMRIRWEKKKGREREGVRRGEEIFLMREKRTGKKMKIFYMFDLL
jgi:hypothetical protein